MASERAVRDARIRSSAACGCPTTARLLVSDTVGFIDRLPHALVAAFSATLEEVAEADLILHVIDAGSPDRERQMAARGRSARRSRAPRTSPMVAVSTRLTRSPRTSGAGCATPDPSAALISATTGTRRRRAAADDRVAARARHAGASRSPFDSGKEFDRQQIGRLYRVARVISHVATNGQGRHRGGRAATTSSNDLTAVESPEQQ